MKNWALGLVAAVAVWACPSALAQEQAKVSGEAIFSSSHIPLVSSEYGKRKIPSAKETLSGFTGFKGHLLTELGTKEISPTPTQISLADALACPTAKAGLTDGWKIFSYQLDREAAISLQLYASGELSAADKVVLYHFMWYKDLLDANGVTIGRCGSGISLVVKVANAKADVKLALPFLAATTQLGLTSVEYKLGTFGLSGPPVDDAIPQASRVGEFNDDAYAALVGAIDKIQAAGKLATTNFTPRLTSLADGGSDVKEIRAALITVSALRAIAAGKKCADEKSAIPGKNGETDGLVQQFYQSYTRTSACSTFDGGPDTNDKTRAAKDLAGFY